MKLLARNGTDLNAKSNDGQTALMLACEQDDVGLVRTLVSVKVNVSAVDNHGRSALSWARYEPEIITILKAAGATE